MIEVKRVSLGSRAGEWLWLAVLLAYAGYFGYLLLSGRLQDLVHPRMTPFVAFGCAVLAAFAVVLARRLLRRAGGAPPSKGGLVLFVLPFAFVPAALNPNSALLSVNRGVSLEQGAPPIDLTTQLKASVNPFLAPKAAQPNAAPVGGPVPPDGTIVLDPKSYYPIYKALYSDPGAYSGRRIRVTGFVYKGGGQPNGQFVTAREMMWCCAADAVAIGFITKSTGAASVPSDQWISVEGTLGTTSYVDQYTHLRSTVPLVIAERVSKLSGPDFPFVYPQ